MRLSEDTCRARLVSARRGVLATRPVDRGPDLVPVCFVVDREHLAVPVDTVKEKSSTDLARRRNLDRDHRASLLVDHWDEDWSQLWWVRARLELDATPTPRLLRDLDEGLRAKYPPYVGTVFADVLVFVVTEMSGWSASS